MVDAISPQTTSEADVPDIMFFGDSNPRVVAMEYKDKDGNIKVAIRAFGVDDFYRTLLLARATAISSEQEILLLQRAAQEQQAQVVPTSEGGLQVIDGKAREVKPTPIKRGRGAKFS